MSGRTVLILLCSGLALGSSLWAQDPVEVQWNGYAKAAVQTQPGNPADRWPFAGATLGAKLEAYWGDWLLRASLEATGDVSGLLDPARDSAWASPAPLTATYTLGQLSQGLVDGKEFYLEGVAGDLMVRAGKQIFTWGLADGNNPTDTLNPRWVGTRFTTTLDEQKIAIPGLLAEFSLPDNRGKVEGILLPLAVPHVLPDVRFRQVVFAGNLFAPGQTVELVSAREPELSLANLEGGVRGLFYGENLTVSASYLTQLDKYFDLEVTQRTVSGTPNMVVTTQTPVYRRVHQWGADFATSFAGLELRGEGAFVLTQDGAGTDLYTKNPSLKSVVQLSKTWFDGTVSTSLTWAPTWVVNHQFWDSYGSSVRNSAFEMAKRNGQAYGLENSLGARVGLTLLGETLKPDVLALVNTAARDYLVTLGATYNLADGWNLKVGANVYGTLIPDDTNRELGVFGNSSADKKDGAYLELRWDF